jgi:hypothetical protein
VEYTAYVPKYLEVFEGERAKARDRATRFGVDYVDPDIMRMNTELLSPEEQEQLRIARLKEKNATAGSSKAPVLINMHQSMYLSISPLVFFMGMLLH